MRQEKTTFAWCYFRDDFQAHALSAIVTLSEAEGKGPSRTSVSGKTLDPVYRPQSGRSRLRDAPLRRDGGLSGDGTLLSEAQTLSPPSPMLRRGEPLASNRLRS